MLHISSLQNARVKEVVKLRNRHHRDKLGKMIIEGYRPIRRALDHQYPLLELYICPAIFLGSNEGALIADAAAAGTPVIEVSQLVFEKMAYRDRPEGLLAIGPCFDSRLPDLEVDPHGLYLIAEAIEKPGNLGTILRSADAAGATGLILCDGCTDLSNPNVVRASIGTLFTVPVVEATSEETIAWCHEHDIRILAATPHTDLCYTEVDMRQGIAIVVGTEQYGLSEAWLKRCDLQVVIPMYGEADSLNVASSTTLLLYEAVRQRRLVGQAASDG